MDKVKYVYRDFKVTVGVVGFKVEIGCSEIYFGNAADLITAITNYLVNPRMTEKNFLSFNQRQSEPIRATQSVTPGPPEERAG